MVQWTVAAEDQANEKHGNLSGAETTLSRSITMTENIMVRNSRLIWWLTKLVGKYHPDTRNLLKFLGEIDSGKTASEILYPELKRG